MSQPTERVCDYVGDDTNAVIGSTDGGFFSRCHSGKIVCEHGTYEEAAAALEAHRAEAGPGCGPADEAVATPLGDRP